MGEASVLGPEARAELIDGEIIDMPPIGSSHASLVADLAERLTLALRGSALIWPQNPVALSGHDAPQPDICLLRPRPDRYRKALPTAGDVLLVVEVSDSTLAYDRDVKAPLYAREGIPESWRLEVSAERLVVQRDPLGGRYTTEEIPREMSRVPIAALPEHTVDLSGLF